MAETGAGPLGHRLLGLGPGKEVPLATVGPEPAQRGDLLGSLDALDRDGQAEVAAEPDDPCEQGVVAADLSVAAPASPSPWPRKLRSILI